MLPPSFECLTILICWALFTNASSPYMMLVALLLYLLSSAYLMTTVSRFFLRALPLELYHIPRWTLWWVPIFVPWHMSRYARAALRPFAEQRAAELREKCGFVTVAVQQPAPRLSGTM